MINVAVINHSTVVSDSDVAAATAAIQTQVTRDYYPIWGINATLTFLTKTMPVDVSWWQIIILDDSDQAGALGYHDLTQSGMPLAKVFAKSDIQYGLSWSVTFSHEALEMLTDPYINLTVFDQHSNTRGRLYAYEVCDAPEDDSFAYDINGWKVSDFVTPAWFEAFRTAGSTQFDFCHHITMPFQLLHGGYIGFFDVKSGTGWQQLTAQTTNMHSHHTANMVEGKSRLLRRGTPHDQWKLSTI